MRSDFEYDSSVPVVDPKDATREAISTIDPAQVVASVKQFAKSYGKRKWRQRPSNAFWTFILVGVDTILVIALFAWVFFILTSIIHLTYQASANLFTIQQGKIILLCFIFVCWSFVAHITHAQSLSYASNLFKSSLCIIIAVTLLTFLSIAIVDPLIGIGFRGSVQAELLFWGVASPILVAWRVFFALILNLPRFRRRAVIVGIDAVSKILAEELHHMKRSTIHILGCIRENAHVQAQIDDFPTLGTRNTLRFLICNQMIDMIIIAVDYKSNVELFREAIDAAQFGIAVVPITVVLESASGKLPVKYVGDQWYTTLPANTSVSCFYLFWEKAMNFTFGIGGLLILLVLLPIIAVLIYLESPGAIFYTQERLGFQGKPLRIYKFRSMRPDAESAGHAVWASMNDPRITKFGRFMRKTHLDELPQVINILHGEMSLIGPRPERVEFVSELEKTIPFYRCRLAIKPGLTGWAQVKYRYGNTDNDALVKLQYDLYYIKHRSFMLDVFIILKTVLEVLQRRGV